ncbi:MAG: hemolysin family protein [Alphaproteobacteria bacterium]|nr:hemolysin family protein [Alphaproteobacteria bacterium]
MEQTHLFSRLIAFFKKKDDGTVRETISELIADDESGEKPSLNDEEREIFSNILRLQEMTVEDVMVPRADMVALSIDATFEEALELMQTKNYSRFPVYAEKMDDIRGFVHIKDIASVRSAKDFDCRKLMCRVLFVPTSMPVIDLLSKMRQEQIPFAIVVDEYGGTDGVVTTWDILREILGDMHEAEHEDMTAKFVKEKEGSYLADARYPIDALETELGVSLIDGEAEEEVDTLGGLVLYLAGRVPDRKEVIEHPAGYEFEVVEATPRTLLEIRISKKDTSAGTRAQ